MPEALMNQSPFSFVRNIPWNILCNLTFNPKADNEDAIAKALGTKFARGMVHHAISELLRCGFIECMESHDKYINIYITELGQTVSDLGKDVIAELRSVGFDFTAYK